MPDEATQSTEVDLVPLNDDDAGSLATLLDGAIGEWLNFHQTHGFYVQGVSTATAVLPVGWQDRLVCVSGGGTNGRTGLCLEPQDVCLAKLAAHREKDTRFVRALIAVGLVETRVLLEPVPNMSTADPRTRTSITAWIRQIELDLGLDGPSLR